MESNNLSSLWMEEGGRNNSEDVLCTNGEAWGAAIVIIEVIFIIFGNVTVLAVVVKFPSKNFRPLNWFIFHLALSDLCIGGITFWIGFLSAKVYSEVTLESGIVSYGILACCTSSSTLGVLYIAFDRYAYILKHNSYKKIMTRKKVIIALIFAWTVPFIVFIIAPLAGWNCISSCDCSIFNEDESMVYCPGMQCSQMMTPFQRSTMLTGGISLFLCLVVACFIYFNILLKVQQKSDEQIHKSRQRKQSEMRMIKTMIIVLTGFLLTTGPLAMLCITSFFHNDRRLHNIMRILVVLSNINSILNPAFYFWRISYMRKNLKKFFAWVLYLFLRICCCCCRNRVVMTLSKRSSIGENLFKNGVARERSESSFSANVKLNQFRSVLAQHTNVSNSSIGN